LRISTIQVLGVSLVFYIMLAVAAMLYIVLEYTPAGRYLFAVGGNPQAARLAGLPVARLLLLAGGLGHHLRIRRVLLLAQLGNASYDVGPPYLLPAFSAAFLGATQIKAGRVNVLGTLMRSTCWRPESTGCN